MFDLWQLVANTLNIVQIVAVDAYHRRSTMLNDIGEIVSDKTIVDRDEYRANLRDGIKSFEQGMRVGSNIGDAVALVDAHLLEHSRPAITASAKLRVRQPQVFVNNSFSFRIQSPGA